ncbi:hypothetical protein [Winogradskyella ouciana]|uniref:Transglutaminase-like superfamily protein n=1 Tax=Winogradskyella ouciana TaxID=2608631 RepID=A0A7K1GE51_9FLAO|nr:hypothetical protein [Winogradskyella ouciana]MTE26688.1 hypothetical protein [Winogradskyella ouciana]
MKKLAIPLALCAVGLVLTAFSFMGSKKGNADDIDISIEKSSFIMPAAHRVYANPDAMDGKYYLFKAKITNNSSQTLEDVTVKYRIPNYVDWTELTVSGEMFPGQTLVVPCYPKFKNDITEKTTESVEKAEIEITWDGADDDDIIEEDFSFKLTNRNEYVYTGIKSEEISSWADMYDNDALIACFVTPNDPIVKYYTQNLQEKLLKGESASVTRKPEDAVRFLTGIYEATRRSHMVYSGTKGIPKSTEDVQSIVQQVRLPREVITGNTGLCIELSVLYASVLSAAGIDPIIYMVPGHAYPGFRMNGQYYAIEATGIGGEGLGNIMSAEDAFKQGQKQLNKFIQQSQAGDPRYTIVDIHNVNAQGVTSMDLKDNDFMRKKVDDIVASWSDGQQVQPNNNGNNTIRVPDNRIRTNNNALSFAIPSGWQTVMQPAPQMPILTAQVMAPDQSTTVSVFDVQTNNVQDAMLTINQHMMNFGMEMQYQANGGNGLIGQTYSSNGTFNWIGKILQTRQGIRFVAVGSPDYMYQQNSGIINQVYNSIR